MLRISRYMESSQVRESSSTKTNIATVNEMLSIFDGTGGSFDGWRKQIALLRTTYCLDENSTRVRICSKLKGNALTWFHLKPEHIEMPTECVLTEIDKMVYHRPSKV